MLALITSIFSALAAIPSVERMINQLVGVWNKLQHDKAMQAIDQAQTDMNKAQTPEEIKKAAEENAEALKKL